MLTQHSLRLSLLAMALAQGCTGGGGELPGKTRPLIAPTAEAIQVAHALQQEFPQARVFFSQNSGDILWIDARGTPLAQGSLDNAQSALAVVQDFMSQHPALYRISDPKSMLQSFNSDLRDLRKADKNANIVSLQFEQTQNGVPIKGKYGVAIFDTSGNLLGIISRLMPTQNFQMASGSGVGTSSQALSNTGGMKPISTGTRQVWHDTDGTGRYRIIEERLERNGIQTVRTLRDPSTGEVLKRFDETPSDLTSPPSDWKSQPGPVYVAAHDASGQVQTIPSTQDQGTLVLGFHLDGIHGPSAAVSIGDAGSQKDRTLVPKTPLATHASDWMSEPAYDSALRAATTLASNLEFTLQWYNTNLKWQSWDGNGSSLIAAVRGHKSPDAAPELNAWGGNGAVLIGDGASSTGQPVSDSLDVVAHEFTHSVINATSPFEYHDEPGALNESLADIFGKTVQGFPDAIEGSGCGAHFRDMANPAACSAPDGSFCKQPDNYTDYRVVSSDSDNGGVHTNSGILNRALTQVVYAQAVGGGASGPAARAAALANMLLGAMREVSFATDTSLEEFAAGLTAYCRVRKDAGSLWPTQEGYCDQLETSFTAGKLLSTPQ
jgi:Zn-dependent metalloprotease